MGKTIANINNSTISIDSNGNLNCDGLASILDGSDSGTANYVITADGTGGRGKV